MGWRYRKYVNIAPGVRLNISKSGVSTTIGKKGVSVNIGKDGAYLNSSIPGTGLYSRQKIAGKANLSTKQKSNSINSIKQNNMDNSNAGFWGNFICVVLIIVVVIGIITGNTIMMIAPAVIFGVIILFAVFASSSVKTVKPDNFLAMTDDYSDYEKNYVKAAKQMMDEQDNEHIKLFLNGLISFYEGNGSNSIKNFAATGLSEAQKKYFIDMIAQFDKLSECERIWFIASSKANSEMKSSANINLERKKTAFAKGCFNHISTNFCEQVPMFRDLEFSYYIYPQFVVKAKTPVEFTIIPLSEISISYYPQRFIESPYEWNWPKDGEVVGHTYEYVNKDGTPDRRYSPNKEVPIYLYGKITIDELGLTYQTSKKDVADSFVKAFKNFKVSMVVNYQPTNNADDVFDPSKQQIKFSQNEITISEEPIEIQYSDPMLEDAARLVVISNSGSISQIQRKFAIGYNRAVRLMDLLEMIGIVGPAKGSAPREVKISDVAVLDALLARIKIVNKQDNVFGITSEYFDNISQTARSLVSFYRELEADNTIMDAVEESLSIQKGNKSQKLLMLILSDFMKNYKKLGHDIESLQGREGFASVLLVGMLLDSKSNLANISYEKINLLSDLVKNIESMFLSVEHSFDKYPDDDFFFIAKILNHCNRNDMTLRYFNLLYRYFSIIAKADYSISTEEKDWLNKLTKFANNKQKELSANFDIKTDTNLNTDQKEKLPVNTKEEDPIAKLNALIGLSNVKNEISNLSNLVKIQKMRESRGMKASNVSYHCVFTGNPGTGKTTVARIVAEIYKQLGVLKKGHLVETDRSGLVAEYVGQTAPKTNAIIDKAMDGVLFIDEAYSLVQGGQNDYGKEAISTLLKRMEDDRDRLVVILAGYSKEMNDFINSNSGLQSRFNRYIDFPDYNSKELLQIFQFIVNNNDCIISDMALSKVSEYIDFKVSHKDPNFGNARFIRNLFEKVITQQANRLTLETNITNEMLSKIEESDIINSIQ